MHNRFALQKGVYTRLVATRHYRRIIAYPELNPSKILVILDGRFHGPCWTPPDLINAINKFVFIDWHRQAPIYILKKTPVSLVGQDTQVPITAPKS